ncbi:MAG TPA: hypothetical protein VM307_00760 [Egibacteraceae bacterium]|nr:hypothetical protein [Egibacteraceae bacterium]
MRIDELELVCQEAARGVAQRSSRPLPATIVLPLPGATRVTALEGWPDDDDDRGALLARFAQEVMGPENAPCYGFVAEGVAATDAEQPMDVVVVAFGARGHHPRITAAPLHDDGVGEFTASESLAPAALPFLAPLQRAVDGAGPPDAFAG